MYSRRDKGHAIQWVSGFYGGIIILKTTYNQTLRFVLAHCIAKILGFLLVKACILLSVSYINLSLLMVDDVLSCLVN
jgi:hypothetical protein